MTTQQIQALSAGKCLPEMQLDTLDGHMSRTVMMTITLKMMRAKANRGSEQNRTEMEGSAEIDGRKKNKKQRESKAIKQKACVR